MCFTRNGAVFWNFTQIESTKKEKQLEKTMSSECKLQGTCFSMCPEKERWLREREGLLHITEMDERTKRQRRPKADPSKIVKCFSRPSAGKYMDDVSELRPAPVLQMTLLYLIRNVAVRSDLDWTIIYEFIFDRTRAIRQDMVIQRLDVQPSINLLEPIVKFHVYAAERLCDRSPREYVPKFNSQHLLECLKRLLVLYDERDKNDEESSGTASSCTVYDKIRSQIEALYILLYIGDVTTLQRGLSLPRKYRESKHVKKAMEISLAWHTKNYVRVCRLIGRLSPLFACAALSNLQRIKRDALEIMSAGYSSRQWTFPSLKLQEILLYEDFEHIKKDCQLFGLTISSENIQFERAKFNKAELLANVEKHFKDSVLHSLLPKILLD